MKAGPKLSYRLLFGCIIRVSRGLSYFVAVNCFQRYFVCCITFNYLLFHSLVEGFAIIVAALIYVLATTYSIRAISMFSFGIAFSYRVLDFTHLLTYKGMGVFRVLGRYFNPVVDRRALCGDIVLTYRRPVLQQKQIALACYCGLLAVTAGLLLT